MGAAFGGGCFGSNLYVHLLQIYAEPNRCGRGGQTTVKPASPLNDEP
jgi:hypothetical protein